MSASESGEGGDGGDQPRTQTAGNLGETAFDSRFYAFEKAHKLDPTSSGHGVRQFKTTLLERLEKDNDPSLKRRVKKSDAGEMQSFYRHYDEKYIQALQNATVKADRVQLTNAYQTANVLSEVLNAVNMAYSISAAGTSTDRSRCWG